jgi:hypothetical protein
MCFGILAPLTCLASQPLIEVKTGYFTFSNSKLRKVYDEGGWDVQLAAAYPLGNLTERWSLHAYGAVEYFHRSGKSLHGSQRTSVYSIPVNIGLKPVFSLTEQIDYYFALGPRYFYLHQSNSSPYVFKSRSDNGVGFFINTGFHYGLCDRLILDIFGEYSYATLQFCRGKPRAYTRNIQVGGITLGGGIGYAF